MCWTVKLQPLYMNGLFFIFKTASSHTHIASKFSYIKTSGIDVLALGLYT